MFDGRRCSSALPALCVALLLLSVARPASGQEAPVAQPGARIRLFQGSKRLEVDFVRATADSVFYHGVCGECVDGTLPRAAIDSIHLRLPAIDRGLRTFRGGIYGAVLSATIFVKVFGCHEGPCALILFLIPPVAAGGAIIGAAVGWLTAPSRWVSAVIPSH